MQGTRVRAVTQGLVLFHFFPFQPSYHYWGHFCLLQWAMVSQVSAKAKGITVVWPCFTKASKGMQQAGEGGTVFHGMGQLFITAYSSYHQ